MREAGAGNDLSSWAKNGRGHFMATEKQIPPAGTRPVAGAPANQDSVNKILSSELQPKSPDRPSSADPSPFSRSAPAQDDESRRQRIADAAYRKAEQRDFAPGHELDDWLEAEREIDTEASRPRSARRLEG
jgi:hypothetical protein